MSNNGSHRDSFTWKIKKLPELPSFDSLRRSGGADSKKGAATGSSSMLQGFKNYIESVAKLYSGKEDSSLVASTPSNISSQVTPIGRLLPPVGIEITGVSTEDLRGVDPSSESESSQSHQHEISLMETVHSQDSGKPLPLRNRGLSFHGHENESEDVYVNPVLNNPGRPRAKSLDPNGALQMNPNVGTRLGPAGSSADSRGLLTVQTTSMPSGFLSPEESEDAEARDQVSELKLNSSVLNSTTLLSTVSSDEARILASNATMSDSLNSSFNAGPSGPFVKTAKMFSGYSKKSTISAPTTPGISLLTLASMTKKSTSTNLTFEAQSSKEPSLPKKYQAPRGALSAHEIHPPLLTSSDSVKTYSLDDFHVIRRVGKGGFAKVFLVRHRRGSRKYYALKCIKKADIIRLKQEKQILNEKNILKKFKHPFIVDLFHSFQTRTHLFMTLEFVPGGDLYSLMKITKV